MHARKIITSLSLDALFCTRNTIVITNDKQNWIPSTTSVFWLLVCFLQLVSWNADITFNSVFTTSYFFIFWSKKHANLHGELPIAAKCGRFEFSVRLAATFDSPYKTSDIRVPRPHYATDNYESLITPHLEHARENKTFRRLLPDALSISRQINVS